jgi:hypothetical protein
LAHASKALDLRVVPRESSIRAEKRPRTSLSPRAWQAAALVTLLLIGGWAHRVCAQAVTYLDRVGDAASRRTDTGADGAIDPVLHRLPDIVSYTLGRWQPTLPQGDLFAGQWTSTGGFFRFDLVLKGLVNPPGPLGAGNPFDPFRYGPNPVFGFIEFDMDDDVDTGGELDEPHLRYLGNAARFSGMPADPRYAGRAAMSVAAFDGNLDTLPWVERSGEEFHIALNGWQIIQIIRSNSATMTFGPGDTWTVIGRLFHRAHGYERFSFACCTARSGSYEPVVPLRFSHDIATDRTRISLVYPLTNAASAAAANKVVVEPLDGDASNQNSVLEALDDLIFSVVNAATAWPADPAYRLINRWAAKDASTFLDPTRWRATILVGTSYSAPGEDALFVWTDIAPDVLPGDFNGDGRVNQTDVLQFDAAMAQFDGLVGVDGDGQVDGAVTLVNFGKNFSPLDVNYDGRIDSADRPVVFLPCDFDHDGDVDLLDFSVFQTCFNGPNRPPARNGCAGADMDNDGDVDLADFSRFQACFNGPNRLPQCQG